MVREGRIVSVSWHEYERKGYDVNTVTYKFTVGKLVNNGKMYIHAIYESEDNGVRYIRIQAATKEPDENGYHSYITWKKLENAAGVNKTYDCNIITED